MAAPQPESGDSHTWQFSIGEGVPISFANVAEVLDYFTREIERWRWLREQQRALSDVARQPVLDVVHNLEVGRTAAELVLKEPAAHSSQYERARDCLAAYFSQVPAVHHRAPLQAFLFELAEQSPIEAALMLAWLFKLQGRVRGQIESPGVAPTSAVASAVALASMWNHRVLASPSSAYEQARSSAMMSDSQGLLDSLKEMRAKGTEAFADLQARGKSFIDESAKLLAAVSDRHAHLHDEQQADWKRLTATYDDKLALAAPSKYWATKGEEHRRLALRFAWATGICGAVGLLLLWRAYGVLFGPLLVTQQPTWGQVLPAALAAVIVLWAVRTLIRLTISHIHLALDAGERRTMILSYLALSRKREVGQEERTALFAAIFRASGDGLVREENPPLPVWELLRGDKRSGP